MNDQSKNEMAEALWIEIRRAIVDSNRVRDCLNAMKEKDTANDLGEHDLLLDTKKLIEQMQVETHRMDEPMSQQPESLKGSIEMFLGEQGQFLPVIKSTLFPKGFFSIN